MNDAEPRCQRRAAIALKAVVRLRGLPSHCVLASLSTGACSTCTCDPSGPRILIQGFICRRLAPIRGVPTKEGGMQGPYSDINAIFTGIEELPQKPAKLIGNFLSWARGEQDPDWGGKKSGSRRRR